MKTNTLEVPEGYEFDKVEDGLIYMKKIKSKYPVSIDEVEGRTYYISTVGNVVKYTDNSINQVSSEARAEAFLALMQLVELRDAWNKVDGFIVDWDDLTDKYTIYYDIYDNTIFGMLYSVKSILYFQSSEVRDKFYETFKDLIETAKELL